MTAGILPSCRIAVSMRAMFRKWSRRARRLRPRHRQRRAGFYDRSARTSSQLVIVSSRPRGATTVNQLSLKVANLDQLKTLFQRVRGEGITTIRQTSRGNALSIYFPDPEGNQIEIYMDTPWHVPQPHGVPIDLSLPNDEIMAQNEKHCRETPGFMPLDQWKTEIANRLSRA
jgi:catechol 2,3-dioxygenase